MIMLDSIKLMTTAIITEMNTAKEMEQLQDCFCVSQGRTKVCQGDKCHGNRNTKSCINSVQKPEQTD